MEGSTIGAEGLCFRVRNGNGRTPFAITAEKLFVENCFSEEVYGVFLHNFMRVTIKSNDKLVAVSFDISAFTHLPYLPRNLQDVFRDI